jgi:hypothetical protein
MTVEQPAPLPHMEPRDRETFDAVAGAMRAAEHELIVEHGVPVVDAIRLVQAVHQASWDRGWYLRGSESGTKEK